MNKKNNKFLSVLTLAGIILIPILNFEYKPNEENIGSEIKLNDEFNICDYRLIPPEMFQSPDGLHYYTTKYNEFLRTLDINNDNILDEFEKDDNLGEITYYQILVERNFDGWWLFDIDNLVWIDTFDDKEVVYLKPYLEFYLQDFFIWSYNERLNLDEINDTRELNRNDIEIDYEIWIDDVVEIGVGWNRLSGEPNDGTEMGNSVYISFDSNGFANSEMGDVEYESIDNSSTYYAGFMNERMAYPSKKQSIDIYDNYSQDEIDFWVGNVFYPRIQKETEGNIDKTIWLDNEFIEEINKFLNKDFIDKYGFENLGKPRSIDESEASNWKKFSMYETPDIRFKETIDDPTSKNEFDITFLDVNGDEMDRYDFNIEEWNKNDWYKEKKLEKFYIKISPIDRKYFLDKDKTIEYYSSDIIDGFYDENGNINEYYITINFWDDIGYNESKPEIPNDNEINSIFWISLSLIILFFFLIIIYFFVKKKNSI